MTTIEYSVPIKNNIYKDIIKKNNIQNPYGYKFNNTAGDIYKENTILSNATDGWIYKNQIEETEDGDLLIAPNLYIQDSKLLHTPLKGLTSILEIQDISALTIPEINIFNGQTETLAAYVPLVDNEQIGVYIFRNKNNQVSIFKKFEYKDLYSASVIPRYSYVFLDDVNGNKMIAANEPKPIPLSEIRNSNRPITNQMLIDAALDYEDVAADLGITNLDFVDMCQKISVSDIKLDLDPANAPYADIILSAEYFPIASDVTVILELNDGNLIQALPDAPPFYVDQLNGAIHLGSCSQVEANYADIKNFHIFYGVVPQVYFEEQTVVEPEYITEPEEPISRYFLDTNHPIFNQHLSTKELNITVDENSSSENISYSFSNFHDKIFVEPNINLVINGKFVKKNQHLILKDNYGILEVKAPIDPIHLLETFVKEDEICYLPAIADENFAVYGVFNTAGAKRATMASKLLFYNTDLPDMEIYLKQAWLGDPPDSYQDFPESEIIAGMDPPNYSLNPIIEAKIIFTPDETGKQIILPVWTELSKLKIYSYYENTPDPDNIEVDPSTYSFIEPDILIFNKMDPHKEYTIIVTPVVYPIVQNYILNNNSFDMIITDLVDLNTTYSSLESLYLLSSYSGSLNFGYIDKTGTKHYFSESVTVNRLITRQFFDKNIPGLKSFIY